MVPDEEDFIIPLGKVNVMKIKKHFNYCCKHKAVLQLKVAENFLKALSARYWTQDPFVPQSRNRCFSQKTNQLSW